MDVRDGERNVERNVERKRRGLVGGTMRGMVRGMVRGQTRGMVGGCFAHDDEAAAVGDQAQQHIRRLHPTGLSVSTRKRSRRRDARAQESLRKSSPSALQNTNRRQTQGHREAFANLPHQPLRTQAGDEKLKGVRRCARTFVTVAFSSASSRSCTSSTRSPCQARPFQSE